ncbi:malectin domain-containing carbohydrate-binding protein [uncultured Zobellia sp.]|uniref:PKD domain-containing protein n=1 Tax=uncultured Zobellia sp. TaxID=255433 RepID=UPI002595761B|nr:malectin domain-containing carbohydrate-binding protein [uncultured Zobellia sp.]
MKIENTFLSVYFWVLSLNMLITGMAYGQSSNPCSSTPFPNDWQTHELQSSELPYRAVYILPKEDLDGDGLKDIVAGGWWYKNPGSASGNWEQKTIGNPFKNVAFVHDFDGDGDQDLLGTQGAYRGADMAWAENDGAGNFTIHTNIPSGRTTYWEKKIQGITSGVFQPGGPFQIAINWNGAESSGSTVQMLTVPADPKSGTWSLTDISDDSLGEDLQSADLDGDGDLDLFQSDNWLRNDGNGNWTTISTGIGYRTTSDRSQLADFDGDGDLDAVVGQLGIGTSASDRKEFAWFEAPSNPSSTWIKHVLATDISSSLSLYATDIDADGDPDIVVGEWKGDNRLLVFENDLCDSGDWIKHTIDAGGTGFDHHDGAQVVDIDNDGDLDVVSIGWDHIVPRIFENKSTITNSSPISDAGEDQTLILPTATITLNGSGSDPDGGALAYKWAQKSGPNTATLANATTKNLTVSGLIEGDYIFQFTVTDNENASDADEVLVKVLPEPIAGSSKLLINAGGQRAVQNGEEFVADEYFDTGSTLNRPQTGLSQPYSSIRFSRTQQMSYHIPLANGDYTVKLHFAEVWFGATGGGSGGIGSRVFDVAIENSRVLDNLDVFAEVGAETLLTKSFNVTVQDGLLDIDFSALASDGGSRHPIINAIEIVGDGEQPSFPPEVNAGNDKTVSLEDTSTYTFNGSGNDPDGGTVSFQWHKQSGPGGVQLSGANTKNLTVSSLVEGDYVFRLQVTDDEGESDFDKVKLKVLPEPTTGAFSLFINAGGSSTVYNGMDFTADQHFDTGSTLNKPQTGLPEPYRSFRFSRSQVMGYDIPLPNGAYSVRLHFAELWFGATGGGSGGIGSRVFDVQLENELVEDNLDVFALAGADALLVRTHSVSITDGVLNIDFSALASDGGSRHPIINAIEIVGEGGQPSLEPIANAGQDQNIVLPVDEVVLDGSGSDPDGGAVSFQWVQVTGPSTATLSSAATSELNVSNLIKGSYVFRLTVTDDESQVDSDEVTVVVSPEAVGLDDHIWLEAECADVGADWLFRTDSSVSGGTYLETPSGNYFNSAPSDDGSRIRFNFSVEEGTYRLYALVDTPTGDTDSFWVRANNGPWLKWNYILGGNGFNWRQLHDKERRTVFVTFNLNEGNNTIDFAHREQGAKLDKIYITKNGQLPTGFGESDFTCSMSSKNSTVQKEADVLSRNSMDSRIGSDLLMEQGESVVSLYPNPAHTEVHISLQEEQKEAEYIAIYTMDGTLVKMEKGNAIQVKPKLYKMDVSILKPEMYVIKVVTVDGGSTIHKMLISN